MTLSALGSAEKGRWFIAWLLLPLPLPAQCCLQCMTLVRTKVGWFRSICNTLYLEKEQTTEGEKKIPQFLIIDN